MSIEDHRPDRSPQPLPPIACLSQRVRKFATAMVGLALMLHLSAALAAPASKKAPPKKPAPATGKSSGALGGGTTPKPAPKPTPQVVALGAAFTSADLDRVFVGNQAGVLKIYDKDKKTVLFVKDANGTDMRGVDGTQWAPIADKHRTAIFTALGIGDAEAVAVARKIIDVFPSIKNGRSAVAVLGVLGSLSGERLPAAEGVGIRRFLSGLLESQKKDVSMRRQTVLALALCAETDADTVNAVVRFMGDSHNAWETFTTRQFFEYHKDRTRSLPEAVDIRQRIEASGNPYAADIAKLLN